MSKKVEVKDLETGEIKTYSSMYKCAKALKVDSKYLQQEVVRRQL